MKTQIAALLLVAFHTSYADSSIPPRARAVAALDESWQFIQSDAPGADAPGFSDKTWQTVSVPHDWSIAGPFDQANPSGGAGAFLPGGIGWYRKHFPLPAEDAKKLISIEFDGVMANSDVWINGFHLGKRPNGYVSFRYDLTGHLVFGPGKENIISVRADNSAQPASRWYSGAGIYRHVRLIITNPLHIEPNGVFVSTPSVSGREAQVKIQTSVVNESKQACQFTVRSLIGEPTRFATAATAESPLQTLAAGARVDITQTIRVPSPLLWDLDHPNLYHALTTIRTDAGSADDEITSFGIRDARFDAATGFSLNGKQMKIKGVCLHQDAGGLGVAVPTPIWKIRLAALKELGVNAIRTSHHPFSPEFLHLCDRMGFLVMDEMFDCWTVGKNPYDYHLHFNKWSKIDLRDTVLRDRNHPSIILYSAGNEIHDTPNANLSKGILHGLVEEFHRHDPTRPVTQALFRPNVSHDYNNGLADMLDVVGQNYREAEILAAHQQKPTRKIVGTENTHDRKAWLALRDNPPYAGQFLWTGIDYLGEARTWPTFTHTSGLLDRTGAIKPSAYERMGWWSDTPMVHIARRVAPTDLMPSDPGYGGEEKHTQVLFSDWSPSSPAAHDETVEVYSNCEEVELTLNGTSLGEKPLPADATPRVWKVPFSPGTIKAIAKNHGHAVASHELHTAAQPAQIQLGLSRAPLDFNAAGGDTVIIRATIADGSGTIAPKADALISFAVSGPAKILAVDNADASSHEPFQTTQRKAYGGECVAILQITGPGNVKVTASADGLLPQTINLP